MILGILLFSIAGIAFLATKYSASFNKFSGKSAVYERPLEQLAAAAAIATVDTDNDGLKDWEESLWKSNPKEADSDRDGTNDGDEVALRRNPTKAGPEDKLDPKNVDASGKAIPENLSETDKIAREFFARYLQASNGGKRELSIEEQEQLVLEITSRANTPIKETYYFVTDIVRVSDSKAAKEKYASELLKILVADKTIFEFKDLIIIRDAFSLEAGVERETLLKELDPFLAQYQTSIATLRKIQVPESAVASHLTLLNGYKIVLESEKKFKEFNTEPISSLDALKGYRLGSNQMTAALIQLKILLEGEGIPFPISVQESTGKESEVTPADFM